jgi:transcription initiation factor TFIIIB Brf1 subunit/transcription initiation factor TFIIB
LQKTIPDHSPMILADLVCAQCGTVLKPKIIKGRRGVDHIEYQCINPEVGCSYRIETNVMIAAEMKGVRNDGSGVKL